MDLADAMAAGAFDFVVVPEAKPLPKKAYTAALRFTPAVKAAAYGRIDIDWPASAADRGHVRLGVTASLPEYPAFTQMLQDGSLGSDVTVYDDHQQCFFDAVHAAIDVCVAPNTLYRFWAQAHGLALIEKESLATLGHVVFLVHNRLISHALLIALDTIFSDDAVIYQLSLLGLDPPAYLLTRSR